MTTFYEFIVGWICLEIFFFAISSCSLVVDVGEVVVEVVVVVVMVVVE